MHDVNNVVDISNHHNDHQLIFSYSPRFFFAPVYNVIRVTCLTNLRMAL